MKTPAIVFIVISSLFLTEPIFAEYYLVYDATPPIIWLNGKHGKHGVCSKHHHTIKKHHPKKMCCHRRNDVRISVSYYFPLVAPCGVSCGPRVAPSACGGACNNTIIINDDYGPSADLNYDEVVYSSSVDPYPSYNYDLTTADDDPYFDPNLDIDR